MVVALAHDAVELGVKVVVAMLVEQGRAGGNHVVIVFLVILYLCKIILRLETQLRVLGDAAELGFGLAIIALGIVQISLVEVGGSTIAAALLQLIILLLGLAVVAVAHLQLS